MTTMQFVGFILGPIALVCFAGIMLFLTRDRHAPGQLPDRVVGPGE